jgi:hypothetical protein
MLGEHLDAASAGYRVGYDDAAHFNREYKSLFGLPPLRVSTLRVSAESWIAYPSQAVTFANGDRLGARALESGTVEIYKNGMLPSSITLNATDKSFFNSKGGMIGVWTLAAPNAVFDDFGGGTVGVTPPPSTATNTPTNTPTARVYSEENCLPCIREQMCYTMWRGTGER